MACRILIYYVNGVVPPGQINPHVIRVIGRAWECPANQIVISSPEIPGNEIATLDENGYYHAEFTLPANFTLQCGQNITVRAECPGEFFCLEQKQVNLECCKFSFVNIRGWRPIDSLTPTQLFVSGILLGCFNDTVVISSSVTTTTNPIAVDNKGEFRAAIPITVPVQCDENITVTVRCGSTSGCSETFTLLLNCSDCFRAEVSIDNSAPCTNAPNPFKRISLTSTITIPANAISKFSWNFGDGNSGPFFTIDNTNGNGATRHNHVDTHDYLPGTYTATLRSSNFDCETRQITVKADCSVAVSCPTVVVDPPQVEQMCSNGKRTVTLTSHITAPAGPSVFAQWNFGNGSSGIGIVVNGGTVANIPQNYDYSPGTYVAQLNILSPSGCSAIPVVLNVPPCEPPTCNLAIQNIIVKIDDCDPIRGTRLVTAKALVNNTSPTDVYIWQWDTNPAQGGLPASQGATQQHEYLAPSTGQNTYSIILTIRRSGTCMSSLSRMITIDGCGAPCPAVTDLIVTPQACTPSMPSTRQIDLTAQITGMAGTTFEWDFGDGSPVVSSSTPTAPRHEYTAPGTYTAKVTARTPTCLDATNTKTFPVDKCDGDGGGSGGGALPSCAILLWASIIMMLVGAVVAIVGCIVEAAGAPQVGIIIQIIGGAIFVLGALLFLLWWIFCRFLTLCDVILAVRDFVTILIVIFAAIDVIMGILTVIFPSIKLCTGFALIYTASLGTILAILNTIAESLGCIIRNPLSGSSSSTGLANIVKDSFQPLTILQQSENRSMGLGDVVSFATSAMGIRPCGNCKKRAERLNRLYPLGVRRQSNLN